MKLLRLFAAGLALLASPLAAQSVKVTDPSTGLPVFSSANPASVKSVSTGASADQVQGNIAGSATDSGNPVKIGGVARDSSGATKNYADGQRTELQATPSGAIYIAPAGVAIGVDTAGAAGFFATPNYAQEATRYVQGVSPQVYSGTAMITQRGDVNGTVVQRGLSATFWTYTSGTTPILSNTTTAVTIKAAAGASIKNFIDSCQITTTAFGASVPLAIRDGAGGTVKWALTVPTAGFLQPVQVAFETPIPSTANTLLEVVTTTANTSGTVTLSCQGHTGT